MIRTYEQGSDYGIRIGEDEIYAFRRSWPGADMGALRSVYAGFDDHGNLFEMKCNGRYGCGRWDGHALNALVHDMQCTAEHALMLDTGRCRDWRPPIWVLPTPRRRSERERERAQQEVRRVQRKGQQERARRRKMTRAISFDGPKRGR